MSSFTNAQVASILRSVSAAYQIKGIGNVFQVRAYDNAATGIEQATSEAQDLYHEGKLGDLPGVGTAISQYLSELFTTGQVGHFDDVLKGIPSAALEFLDIPGVGPKTAYKLATEGGATSITDLEAKIHCGELTKAGFTAKAVANLDRGLKQLRGLSTRLLLPQALEIAHSLTQALKSYPSVLDAYPLGSMRRMVATVGDIDLAVSTRHPQRVIEIFTNLPQVRDVTDRGSEKASVVLKNGLQVDLLTARPEYFGSALQHFTGSKAHNIHLREYAKGLGWSISEHGVRNIKTGEVFEAKTEGKVYEKLAMSVPPPELREDSGEIELAIKHELPTLVTLKDLRGDMHTHTSYSDGQSSLTEMADFAQSLGYSYLASTDHSYPNLDFERRLKDIEDYNYSHGDFRVIKGLEVNITTESKLQVPDRVLIKHEFNTASIHSGFSQPVSTLTDRVIMALQHPLISMISHPTGRLLGERPGYDLDWEKVFAAAKHYDKILEIDGFPNRSDLPDQLIREAVKRGLKLAIDTDAHHTVHLTLMNFGVALARRGWCTPDLVVNSWPLQRLLKYLAQPRIK